MAYQLRTRASIDYRRLAEGEDVPRATRLSSVAVLPDSYEVERLVSRKSLPTGTLYLVKWSGYHTEQCTWEPEGHISQHLLDTYLQPSVSDCRVTDAAIRVEGAIQQRLRSRGNRCVVDFDLDIYRHCFASDRTILADKDDFDKLPMSAHWYYNVNKCGRGCQVSFPIKCEPKLYFRKTYAYCDGVVREVKVPCERLVLTSAVDGIAF